METFRTVIHPIKEDWEMDHQTSILMLGSCFTDNIGQRLSADAFDVRYDLFGTLFNPVSINDLLGRAVEEQFFKENEFIERDGLWHHFGLTHVMSNPDLTMAIKTANESLRLLKKRILKADYIIITYGTAWVYHHKKMGMIVANCHKFPNKQFDKVLLDDVALDAAVQSSKHVISKVNPKAKFIFTVSPVRHWKDGAVENSLSKSRLRVCVGKGVVTDTKYFPAYEIIMDDLRDYRFYKKDMLHPNEQAVDYIYEFFEKSFFEAKTAQLVKRIRRLKNAQNHRALNKNSDAHKDFEKKTSEDLTALFNEYPFLEKRWSVKLK